MIIYRNLVDWSKAKPVHSWMAFWSSIFSQWGGSQLSSQWGGSLDCSEWGGSGPASECICSSTCTKLLDEVEQEAIKNGCVFSLVDTWDFQAEEFYLKKGYERIGELKNYWLGHSKIFLRKNLRSSNEGLWTPVTPNPLSSIIIEAYLGTKGLIILMPCKSYGCQDAWSKESSLRRAFAMYPSTAKACRFSNGINPLKGCPIFFQHSALKIGLNSP